MSHLPLSLPINMNSGSREWIFQQWVQRPEGNISEYDAYIDIPLIHFSSWYMPSPEFPAWFTIFSCLLNLWIPLKRGPASIRFRNVSFKNFYKTSLVFQDQGYCSWIFRRTCYVIWYLNSYSVGHIFEVDKIVWKRGGELNSILLIQWCEEK